MANRIIQKIAALFLPELQYASLNFSQEGEEQVIRRYFNNKRGGFYVDVGAHHPFKFSNTYSFYKRGWTGINIDPLPGIMNSFRRFRKKDINLETGVSRTPGMLTYYRFDEPAVNTFSAAMAKTTQEEGRYRLLGTVSIETLTLAGILEQHLPAGREIDFLSIDAEGLDLDVLASNNWEKFRPRLILVESHNFVMEHATEHPLYRLMQDNHYRLLAKTYYTIFFERIR